MPPLQLYVWATLYGPIAMETLCDFLYAQVAAVAQRSSKTVLTFLACPREFQMNLPDRLRQCVSGSSALQPQVVQRAAVFSVLTILFTVGVFSAIAEQTPTIVTQKGRAFKPGTLVLKAGDTVEIVNDDGELIHHAYVASESFSFDSGDQEPGSKTDVVFTTPGKFTVLCGIHPKMHLDVEVK